MLRIGAFICFSCFRFEYANSNECLWISFIVISNMFVHVYIGKYDRFISK